jgi:hypothetical protein
MGPTTASSINNNSNKSLTMLDQPLIVPVEGCFITEGSDAMKKILDTNKVKALVEKRRNSKQEKRIDSLLCFPISEGKREFGRKPKS